jgi:hypothetical protein
LSEPALYCKPVVGSKVVSNVRVVFLVDGSSQVYLASPELEAVLRSQPAKQVEFAVTDVQKFVTKAKHGTLVAHRRPSIDLSFDNKSHNNLTVSRYVVSAFEYFLQCHVTRFRHVNCYQKRRT